MSNTFAEISENPNVGRESNQTFCMSKNYTIDKKERSVELLQLEE
jgi:hypothetical protein